VQVLFVLAKHKARAPSGEAACEPRKEWRRTSSRQHDKKRKEFTF
jgi:hypothetical protein